MPDLEVRRCIGIVLFGKSGVLRTRFRGKSQRLFLRGNLLQSDVLEGCEACTS